MQRAVTPPSYFDIGGSNPSLRSGVIDGGRSSNRLKRRAVNSVWCEFDSHRSPWSKYATRLAGKESVRWAQAYVGTAPRAWFGGCAAVMHVRFAGQRFDVPLATLQVTPDSEDYRVRVAVARYLCLPDGARACLCGRSACQRRPHNPPAGGVRLIHRVGVLAHRARAVGYKNCGGSKRSFGVVQW